MFEAGVEACATRTHIFEMILECPEPFLFYLAFRGLLYTNCRCAKCCPAERILTVSNVQYFVICIHKFNKLMLGSVSRCMCRGCIAWYNHLTSFCRQCVCTLYTTVIFMYLCIYVYIIHTHKSCLDKNWCNIIFTTHNFIRQYLIWSNKKIWLSAVADCGELLFKTSEKLALWILTKRKQFSWETREPSNLVKL
jgi:hypothetical protein